MISPPTKTFQIHQGQRIAQLLLLPYYNAIGQTATQNERQDKGFGSSDMAFWVTEITKKRPMKSILVSGKSIETCNNTGTIRYNGANAPSIVGITCYNLTLVVGNSNNIALKVLLEVIRKTVIDNTTNGFLIIINTV